VNALKNLKTMTKLMASFGSIGVLLVAIGWMSINGINQLNERMEVIYKVNLTPIKLLGDLHGRSERMSALVAWHILAYDSATVAKWTAEIDKLDEEVDTFLATYPPIIVSESERKFYEQYQTTWSEYKEIRAKVLTLSAAFSKDAASELQRTELAAKLAVILEAIEGLTHENEMQAKESYEFSQDLASKLQTTNIAIVSAGLVLGFLLGWVISRMVANGLANILKAAQDLGAGNLTARSSVTTQDDIGSLAKVFNEMGEKIETNVNETLEFKYKIAAIDKTQTVVECNLDGTVLTANQNFLSTFGYNLDEIKGHHHRMFADPAYAASGEYTAFWAKLNRGEFDAGVYKRISKGGNEVWIQASYNPIMDANGKAYKVVEYATDITGQKKAQNEVEKLIKAAAAGQLSERIKTDEFTGASKDLTESFNRLLDSVVTPLHEAQQVMTALAANDLTKTMTGSYQGEFDQIKSSLNSALTNLTATVSTVRDAVEAVSAGSEQITKGSEDLSQRTSEQASALEETSASMEEMTSTVKQNADNAKQANQLAIAARDIADKGGSVTARAVEAMGEINKSSKKIADIITVIDEIAFQTNLLALNAAVEAARAGEHGRGFAVVAAEVRNLAQRSATAAKEIKGLINESIQRVTDGSELVHQSGKTLGEIVSSVKRVTDIIAEIAAASLEQASGIDQVNKAIMQMDESTQQNAALVEETTSASQSMKDQAKELIRQVEVFKVNGTSEAPHVKRETHTGRGASDSGTKYTSRPTLHATPKPMGKKPLAGVASGNGKDRRAKDNDFEEF